MKKYRELNEQEINSVKNKFGMLTEYSFITNRNDLLLDEDDDDEMIPPEPQADMSQQQGGEAQLPMDGQEAPQVDNPMGGSQGMPAMDTPQEMPMPDTEQAPEVEVDVTQLTQDQKQVDDKVTALTDQTAQMMELLSTITTKVDDITNKISQDTESIRQEIEKRNPTPKETLQKRQTLGDPFNQTPEDFWKQKESEGTYELSDDNNTEKEYEIHASDLDSNPSSVYKSFGLKDNEVNQSLKGIMGY